MNIVEGEGKKCEMLGGPAEEGAGAGGVEGVRERGESGGRESGEGEEEVGRGRGRGSGRTSTSTLPPPPASPLDLNTVQVTNMAQLHSFVFEDWHKSCFKSIQDADPCPRVLC